MNGGFIKNLKTGSCTSLAKEKPEFFYEYTMLIARIMELAGGDFVKAGAPVLVVEAHAIGRDDIVAVQGSGGSDLRRAPFYIKLRSRPWETADTDREVNTQRSSRTSASADLREGREREPTGRFTTARPCCAGRCPVSLSLPPRTVRDSMKPPCSSCHWLVMTTDRAPIKVRALSRHASSRNESHTKYSDPNTNGNASY